METKFLVTSESFNKMVQINSHRDRLTQEWCWDNFPSLIDKDRWLPKSPDLDPLDYSIWDKLINVIEWNKVGTKTGDTD